MKVKIRNPDGYSVCIFITGSFSKCLIRNRLLFRVTPGAILQVYKERLNLFRAHH